MAKMKKSDEKTSDDVLAERRSELDKAVQHYLREHDAWANTRGRPEHPDDRYAEAVELLAVVFERQDVPMPGDWLAVNNAVCDFIDEWDVYRESGQGEPSDDLWAKRQALEAAYRGMQPPALKPLETIAELREQKVSERQIARMWGFVDADGEPMPHLVQKEFENPGSITKTPGAVAGRDWVDPRLKDIQEAQAVIEEITEKLVEHHEVATAKREPCHETLEELFEQGVSARQAAKMLVREYDDVLGEYVRLEGEKDKRAKERAARDANEALAGVK